MKCPSVAHFIWLALATSVARADIDVDDGAIPRPGGRVELGAAIDRAVLEHREREWAIREELERWFDRGAIPGNRLELLRDGKTVYRERLALMKAARRSIYLSAYSFNASKAGLWMKGWLCYRAAQGIDVRILVDSWGSKGLKEHANDLRACGARILFFNPIRWDLAKAHYILHEKLLIADGRMLLMGGFGYGNHYVTASRDSKNWHDLDMKMTGPAVCWFHRRFEESWKVTVRMDQRANFDPVGSTPRSEKLEDWLYGEQPSHPCDETPAGDARVHPLHANPLFVSERASRLDDKRPILRAHLRAIALSSSEILLYAPYFIPHDDLVEALIRARTLNGARVVILTNSAKSTDEGSITNSGMFLKIRKLLRAGVEVREWTRTSTMHRKAGVYDGRWAYVGSDNQDKRGQDYSSESVAFSDDPAFIADVRADFLADLEHSSPLTVEQANRYLRSQNPFLLILTKWLLPFM